ncbi:MAG TPA: VOC family protein [Bacteroidota bacterium]|nr:VOC family protein [Bacteroidota bacterium]
MGDTLPQQTRIQYVRLRVRDLSRVRDFYQKVLGFHVVGSDEKTVALSATGQPPFQIELMEDPRSVQRPPQSPGLFHVAFRYADREALAAALFRLVELKYPIEGAADHAVSEAIYLSDPEDNGVELYCDRPRDSWLWRNGEVYMVTEPLDVGDLLNNARVAPSALDPRTEVGHVHLSVSNLAKAEEFYSGVLGFEVTMRSYPGALFFAADGYHHHVGTNVWRTRNGVSAPHNAMGLMEFGIVVPRNTWKAVGERLTRHGLRFEEPSEGVMRLSDYDGIGVVIAM